MCAHTGRHPPKEAFQVRTLWWSDWNISSFQTLGKNTKNWNRYLKICLWAVWICIFMCLKYLRIWINESVWKNSFKTQNIPVMFHLTVPTFGEKIYFISTNYHISAISGCLADGRDHADLFKKRFWKSNNFWSLLNFSGISKFS